MTLAHEAEAAAPGSAHPVRGRLWRRKFDKQPTQPAGVLIASNGSPIPVAALRAALRLSAGDAVAVLTVARVYGSSLGLPNPGLMPSRREMAEQREIIDRAMRSLEKGGAETWGQIAATRKPGKAIAQAAQARGVRHVLVVRPEQQARWRQIVEGDLVKEVARRLAPAVSVNGVNP